MFLIAVIILVIGILVYFLQKVRKEKQNVQSRPKFIAPAKNPVQKPVSHLYRLCHYSPDISGSGKIFGLFQTGRDYWIVDSSDIKNPKNILDIYPAFKGRPIGMVVLPSRVSPEGFARAESSPFSFIIFSSDGKVYNPFSVSHSWRNDFLYLPNEDPISIDGRPLEAGITNGLFSGGNDGKILFRFYYSGYYIEETGCKLSGTDTVEHPSCDGKCPQIKFCENKKVTITPHPPVNINSFYQYAGKLYGISSDGYVYVKGATQWDKDSHWITTFNGLSLATPQKLSASLQDKTKLFLMGADYDDGIPVFLIFENGTRYIIDKHARKYDFFHFLKDKNISPQGNPLDFTKAGSGEYDYIVLYSDKNIYGSSLKSLSKPVSDFEKFYPSLSAGSQLISITSVSKWNDPSGGLSTTQMYYLVFLYDSGQWFEIQYDILGDKIGALGQTDQISGKWNEWSHIRDVLKTIDKSTQSFKISSFGWSIFVFDTQYKFENDLVYSINNKPESWIDMLYCMSIEDENGDYKFKTSSCVGVGEWKDYEGAKTLSESKDGNKQYKGFNVYEDYGMGNGAGDIVQRKISLDKCLENKGSVIVYDQAESDCHIYNSTSLTLNQTIRDPSKSIFILPEYNAKFQNRFCIKHRPSNKYLYWDFIDPDKQFLGLRDACTYTGPDLSNVDNPSETDVHNLQKSLGSLWSSDPSGGLRNLNGAVGGYLNIDFTISQQPDLNFNYSQNNFNDGKGGTCFHSDGDSKFAYTPQCSGEWEISVPPCSTGDSGGYCN